MKKVKGTSEYHVITASQLLAEGYCYLPKEQRKWNIWSMANIRSFIEYLAEGRDVPGQVLLHRTNTEDIRKIFDGQQRGNACAVYKNRTDLFFHDYDVVVEEICDIIAPYVAVCKPHESPARLRDQVHNSVERFLQGDNKQDTLFLSNDLLCSMLGVQEKVSFADASGIMAVQAKILKMVNDYLDLDEVRVPIHDFTGPRSEAIVLFNALNSRGSNLTKYDNFAALWSDQFVTLPQSPKATELIDSISQYYHEMNQGAFELTGFSEGEIRTNRKVNISEFCRSFGKAIAAAAPALFRTKASDADIDNIGHTTLAITLGVPSNELEDIVDHMIAFDNPVFVESYLDKVFHEFGVLQNIFAPYLKHFGTEDGNYEAGATSILFCLSMFASLWHARYETNQESGEIKVDASKKAIYERTKKNLPIYFALAIVEGNWRGSGDARLNSFYIQPEEGGVRTYDVTPKRAYVEDALKRWVRQNMDDTAGKTRPSKTTKALLLMAASAHRTIFTQGSYDIEHMFDKKALKSCADASGAALGNLFHLAHGTNRGKRDQSLYSLEDAHDGMCFSSDYLAAINYPEKSAYDDSKRGILAGDAELANQVIYERGCAIVQELATELYKNQSA